MFSRLKELLFQNRSTRQTVAKNTFWLTTSEIGARFIRAGIIIYAARVLGAENFGVFSYALGLAGFFTVFADVGLSALLTREAAQKPEARFNYFATAFTLKSFLLFGTALAIVFVAPFFSRIEAARALIPFIALLTIADGIRDFALAFFRALEKMELQALITLITNISIAIFGFATLYISATAEALTFSYIASAGAGAGAAVFLLRDEFRKIFSFFDKNLVYPILRSAWPIAVIATIGAFMLNVDIVMLGWFMDAKAVGLYSASQKIVVMLYTIPSILAMALFPTMSRYIGEETPERMRYLMENAVALTLALAIPMTVGGVVLGKEIIVFAYGSEFISASLSFQILIATLLFTFPGPIMGNMIFGYDKHRKYTPYVGLASLGNVAFNYLLIPIYGIAGAAIATLGAQTISNLGLLIVAMKINSFAIMRPLKKIILAALIMGGASYTMNVFSVHVIPNIIISAAIYGAMLYALKERVVMEIMGLLQKI